MQAKGVPFCYFIVKDSDVTAVLLYLPLQTARLINCLVHEIVSLSKRVKRIDDGSGDGSVPTMSPGRQIVPVPDSPSVGNARS